jgi:hypothetical protein
MKFPRIAERRMRYDQGALLSQGLPVSTGTGMSLLPLLELAFVFCALRSHCQYGRKRESQHRVTGRKTPRSRLHPGFQCTTAERMAPHRKLDRRHVYLLRGCAWQTGLQHCFNTSTSERTKRACAAFIENKSGFPVLFSILTQSENA